MRGPRLNGPNNGNVSALVLRVISSENQSTAIATVGALLAAGLPGWRRQQRLVFERDARWEVENLVGKIGAGRGLVGAGNRDECDVDLHVGGFRGRRPGAQATDRNQAAGEVSGYVRASAGA